MVAFAYGFNPYVYCLGQLEPDWDTLLRGKDDLLYGLIVLTNDTGLDGREIRSFDYDALLSTFHKPLESRTSRDTPTSASCLPRPRPAIQGKSKRYSSRI